jgi:transposase
VAGLDIAKAAVEVTIRVPSDTARGRRRQETRTFGTTRRELLDLAAWLARWEVAKAGMEATGDYWKPVFFLLESQGLDCELYNAGQVKALPGRPKTGRAEPGLARQDHRAGDDLFQLRAARAGPPPAHPHPLPPSPDPGPHRREAAGGESCPETGT